MKIRNIVRGIRWTVSLCGILLIAIVVTAFTSVPWTWYGWLAVPEPNTPNTPDYIVMMGGGGIPSESGLTRAWKTAEAAAMFPNAKVIVAMPDEASKPEIRTIEYELEVHGVARDRIRRESNGRNTREQAVEVFKMLKDQLGGQEVTIGLVTSPAHMRRTWGAFKKAGFRNLNVYPSWPEEIEADMSYQESESEGSSLLENVGGNTTIRYRFWDNLAIMGRCNRETVALVYYKLLGWI